jgi:hypothetical protein
MINKHSRESARTRARKQRESIIRGILASIATLIVASAAFWFWRHGLNPNRGRGSATSELATQLPSSNNNSKWSEDVKSRTVVASVIFGEHDVIPLNANGENVSDTQLSFTKDASVPPEPQTPNSEKEGEPVSSDAGSMARKGSQEPDAKEKTVAADTSAERAAPNK